MPDTRSTFLLVQGWDGGGILIFIVCQQYPALVASLYNTCEHVIRFLKDFLKYTCIDGILSFFIN